MFKTDQVNQILKEKNSAFKILIDTQNKLKKSCEKAFGFIGKNEAEIVTKQEEITSLSDVNGSLNGQIKAMEASIQQTESIINPPIAETPDESKE